MLLNKKSKKIIFLICCINIRFYFYYKYVIYLKNKSINKYFSRIQSKNKSFLVSGWIESSLLHLIDFFIRIRVII